jgi:hypothetical protein
MILYITPLYTSPPFRQGMLESRGGRLGFVILGTRYPHPGGYDGLVYKGIMLTHMPFIMRCRAVLHRVKSGTEDHNLQLLTEYYVFKNLFFMIDFYI